MKEVVVKEINNLLYYGVDIETILKTYLSSTMEQEKVLTAVQYILENYSIQNGELIQQCHEFVDQFQKKELTVSEKIQNMLAVGMTPEAIINDFLASNMDELSKKELIQYVLLNYSVKKDDIDKKIHFMYTNDTSPLIESFEPSFINPILDKVISKESSLTEEEAEILIRWISSKTKEGLQIAACLQTGKDINWDNLFGACGIGQGISGLLCKNLGLEVTSNNVADTISDYRHAYLSVEIPVNNSFKTYIIDCTYRQFFTFWWLNTNEKNVGLHMQEKPHLTAFANHVLKNGYFELTEANWECYQYGFTGVEKHLTEGEIKEILKTYQDELDYEEEELNEWGVSVRR